MKSLKAAKKSIQVSKLKKLSLKQSRKIVGGIRALDQCPECS